MSKSTQCTKPTVVGASGSYIVTANDFVPAGAPDQARSGLWLLPVQPKSSKTALCGIVWPSRKTELVTVSVACVAMGGLYPETARPRGGSTHHGYGSDSRRHAARGAQGRRGDLGGPRLVPHPAGERPPRGHRQGAG